ncbi:MAG: hypothetical protein RR816_12805, partial [Clostridia bacterium]
DLTGFVGDDYNVLGNLINQNAANIQTDLEGMRGKADRVSAGLARVKNNARINEEIKLRAEGAFNVINSLLSGLAAIWAFLGKLVNPPKFGGGGGGGKDDAPAEEAKKSAYELAIERLDHLKALDQLTYEQELAQLQDIERRTALSAEERMAWEERVHDVKKNIAERDAQNLDKLADGITDALTNRYEAMRDAELDAVSKSKKAWEEWRDSSVASVQAQIDALDKLEDAEDREGKKQEHLRKIAKLKEQMQYEQDAYNRANIQKQLDAAQKAYDDYLHKLDIADQKDALKEQSDAIKDKTKEEIAKLDKQAEEIKALYDERLKAANIAAEAEKILTSNTQAQMIELIKSYAPDYEATGKTLGERLLAGFQNKVGDVKAWLDSLNASIEAAQSRAVAAATGRGYSGGGSAQSNNAARVVHIAQNNTFTVPVETPSETARRIAIANESMVDALLSDI